MNTIKKSTMVLLAVIVMIAALPTMTFTASAATSLSVFGGRDTLSMALFEGRTFQFDGVAHTTSLTWTSSDSSVVKIEEDGLVAKGIGTATVTAKTAGGLKDSVTVTVREPITIAASGTQQVFTNRDYPVRTFKFVPTKDYTYSFVHEDYVYMTTAILFDENGTAIAGDDDLYGIGFSFRKTLKAGQTYYLLTYCQNVEQLGSAYYRIEVHNWSSCVSGLEFESDQINACVGDVLLPELTAMSLSEQQLTFTCSPTQVASVDEYGYVYANGNGHAVLTVQDQFGNKDTVSLVIGSARRLECGANSMGEYSREVYYAAHVFEASVDDVFSIHSNGAGFIYAELYDNDGLLEYTEEVVYGDFYMAPNMKAGEMVVLYVQPLDSNRNIQILVEKDSQATTMDSKVAYPFERFGSEVIDGALYSVVYTHTPFMMQSDFGTATGALAQTVTYTFDKSTVVDYGSGMYAVTQAGMYTITARSAYGLTDTVNIKAIDYYSGDVNEDGQVNLRDALVLYQYTSSGKAYSQLALGEITGDNQINMRDVLLLYKTITE